MTESKRKKEVTARLTDEEWELFKHDAYETNLGQQGVLVQAWLEWRERHRRAERESVDLSTLPRGQREFAEFAARLYEKQYGEWEPDIFRLMRQIFDHAKKAGYPMKPQRNKK